MPTHTITHTWSNGNIRDWGATPPNTLTTTVALSVVTEGSIDTPLSGGQYGYISGVSYDMSKLVDLYAAPFGGGCILRTHLSGVYTSGGVANTYYLNSGIPVTWELQVSGLPNPFFPAQISGIVTAVSLQNNSPGTVSGIVKLGFSV